MEPTEPFPRSPSRRSSRWTSRRSSRRQSPSPSRRQSRPAPLPSRTAPSTPRSPSPSSPQPSPSTSSRCASKARPLTTSTSCSRTRSSMARSTSPSTRGSSSRSGRGSSTPSSRPGRRCPSAPIAFFWGPAISQQHFSVAIGSLNVVLCYATLRTLFQSRAVAVWGGDPARLRDDRLVPRRGRLRLVLRSHRRDRVPLALPPRSAPREALLLDRALPERRVSVAPDDHGRRDLLSDLLLRRLRHTLAGRRSRIHWRNVLALAAGVRSRSPRLLPLQLPPLRDDRGSRLHPGPPPHGIRPTCTASSA